MFSSYLTQLSIEIRSIEQENFTLTQRYKKCASVAQACFQKVQDLLRTHAFNDAQDEINFFKEIQPQMLSQLIFYKALLKHETKLLSLCRNKEKKSYCKLKLKNIQAFLTDHNEFITYYKSRESFQDEHYFTRSKSNYPFVLEENMIWCDPTCSTGYDVIAARLLAYERLHLFLNIEIKTLNSTYPIPKEHLSWVSDNDFIWTNSKTDFIEFVYVLYYARCIKNGNAKISEIFTALKTLFKVDIDDPHHFFNDIKKRNHQSKFIDFMRDAYLREISKDDE